MSTNLGKFTLPNSKECAIRFRLMKQMPPSPAQSLLPGLAAAALIGFLVQEKTRRPVADASFGDRLRVMPKAYRQFLLAVGIFGAGAFAHTLLILGRKWRSATPLSYFLLAPYSWHGSVR